MAFHKKHAITLTACLLATVSFAAAAQADGMPYRPKKTVRPVELPLDQAVDEVENKEPPVAVVAPPPKAEEPIENFEPVAVVPESPPPVPESRIVEVQENTSFFGLSVGMYDPLRDGDRTVAFNAEYQHGTKILGFLQPLFGAMVSTDGTMFGYGGVGVPVNVTDHIFIMPSVAVGAYKEGAGFDLGQTIAYRFGGEIAYQFDDRSRLGINAHYISNGNSLHSRDNTGIIALTYTVPTSLFAGEAKADLAAVE